MNGSGTDAAFTCSSEGPVFKGLPLTMVRSCALESAFKQCVLILNLYFSFTLWIHLVIVLFKQRFQMFFKFHFLLINIFLLFSVVCYLNYLLRNILFVRINFYNRWSYGSKMFFKLWFIIKPENNCFSICKRLHLSSNPCFPAFLKDTTLLAWRGRTGGHLTSRLLLSIVAQSFRSDPCNWPIDWWQAWCKPAPYGQTREVTGGRDDAYLHQPPGTNSIHWHRGCWEQARQTRWREGDGKATRRGEEDADKNDSDKWKSRDGRKKTCSRVSEYKWTK